MSLEHQNLQSLNLFQQQLSLKASNKTLFERVNKRNHFFTTNLLQKFIDSVEPFIYPHFNINTKNTPEEIIKKIKIRFKLEKLP
jgi:gluconate kinase